MATLADLLFRTVDGVFAVDHKQRITYWNPGCEQMLGIPSVRAVGGEAVVIALLHAYRNAAHEHLVRDIVRRHAPDLAVICACEVWPVIREYERTVTAVVAVFNRETESWC